MVAAPGCRGGPSGRRGASRTPCSASGRSRLPRRAAARGTDVGITAPNGSASEHSLGGSAVPDPCSRVAASPGGRICTRGRVWRASSTIGLQRSRNGPVTVSTCSFGHGAGAEGPLPSPHADLAVPRVRGPRTRSRCGVGGTPPPRWRRGPGADGRPDAAGDGGCPLRPGFDGLPPGWRRQLVAADHIGQPVRLRIEEPVAVGEISGGLQGGSALVDVDDLGEEVLEAGR